MKNEEIIKGDDFGGVCEKEGTIISINNFPKMYNVYGLIVNEATIKLALTTPQFKGKTLKDFEIK